MLLNVYARLKEDRPWAEKGYAVAKKQFELAEYNYPASVAGNDESKPLIIDFGDTATHITAGNTVIAINHNGALSKMAIDGEEIIKAPLEPYFWKAFNDNQIASHLADRTASWREAGETREMKNPQPTIKHNSDGTVTLVYDFVLSVGADYTLAYTINPDGKIMVKAQYTPKADDIELIPKFGMRMRIPAEYDEVKWYGRGPWENYPDRKRSAFIGEYSMPLSDMMTEYIHPQENGNRSDVRWFEIASDNRTLHIEGMQPLCIRAWDYGEEDLDVRHTHEIHRGDFVNLNIDLNIHGVAGTDTWGQRALPQYTIDGNLPYEYGFIISVK